MKLHEFLKAYAQAVLQAKGNSSALAEAAKSCPKVVNHLVNLECIRIEHQGVSKDYHITLLKRSHAFREPSQITYIHYTLPHSKQFNTFTHQEVFDILGAFVQDSWI